MRRFYWVICALALLGSANFALEPQDYAFLLTAQVSVDAPRIAISWPQKNSGSISVRRKLLGEPQWGAPIAELDANATSFIDTNVAKGIRYEYEVSAEIGAEEPPLHAYGYICAGIEIPVVEQRGKVALVVDDRFSDELRDELETLRKDLIGNGWAVTRHDVSMDASVQSVKELIKADYDADRERMRAVFLIGHVPVPYSGLMAPDFHAEHTGAWPADVFYGEMDGAWTDDTVNWEGSEFSANNNMPGDGKFDQSEIPGAVEMEVGRVDMWDLPSFDPRTEVELLRNYLRKDHAFRHAITRAPVRGLIRDNFGIVQDDAPAADAWRAFPALFGTNSWTEVGDGEFFPTLNNQAYLWAFGCGGGDRNKADGVGTTEDFAARDPQAVFYLLHGSWFGDWNTSDNFLRAAIATEDYGLVSIWSSLPHWYFHPLALGETIGYATRLTQNNRGLYQNDPNYFQAQTHISMMGDPTLPVFTLAPPRNVLAITNESVRIEWDASSDTVEGYNIYRATNLDAVFEKLNGEPTKDLWFEDAPGPGSYVYMVKAVALQTTGSGTFWNLSQGVFVETSIEEKITPVILLPTLSQTGTFEFEAKGFARRAYRVESRGFDGAWRTRETGVSGEDGLVTYQEDLPSEGGGEFYRVVWE